MRDRQIDEYKIVSGLCYMTLTEEVTRQMKLNWQPYGSSYQGVNGYFYQTMVKYRFL